jgi:NAD(P)-dependent dehydrogenase (short-subunit alcohol dehydrogenase family)
MARIFITGSSDGLGLLAGQLLAGDDHEVTLHARDDARADATAQLGSESVAPDSERVFKNARQISNRPNNCA